MKVIRQVRVGILIQSEGEVRPRRFGAPFYSERPLTSVRRKPWPKMLEAEMLRSDDGLEKLPEDRGTVGQPDIHRDCVSEGHVVVLGLP